MVDVLETLLACHRKLLVLVSGSPHTILPNSCSLLLQPKDYSTERLYSLQGYKKIAGKTLTYLLSFDLEWLGEDLEMRSRVATAGKAPNAKAQALPRFLVSITNVLFQIGRIMKYHIENQHIFLSEAVEASQCHFFENWLMKLKCPDLLKPLSTIIQQFFYPSIPHFTMRHPV